MKKISLPKLNLEPAIKAVKEFTDVLLNPSKNVRPSVIPYNPDPLPVPPPARNIRGEKHCITCQCYRGRI